MARLSYAIARLGRVPLDATIIFAGAVLRFWRLDYHSVWFDEAVSLRWASADLTYIWQVTFRLVEEKHPPAYFIYLHLWRTLAGWIGLASNDAFLRASGSLLGVLTVWGILRFGTTVGDRAVGRTGALLVALSPILTWYSQELRMFQPAVTGIVWFAAAVASAWGEEHRPWRAWWWLVAVVAMSLALYAYLFSAFVLPAAGITLLALAWKDRRWPRFAEGVTALTLIALFFAPLARNAWGVNAAESTPGVPFSDFLPNMLHLLRVYTIWRVPWVEGWKAVSMTCLGLLILAGLTLPRGDGGRRDSPFRLWLLLWLGIPLLVANLLLARSRSIFHEDRYLLFLAPFLLTAAANGVVRLSHHVRPLGLAGGAAAVLALASALPPLWTPALARENWRAAAGYIVEHSGMSPDMPAAALAHVDYTRLPLEWYIRKSYTFEQLPVFFPFGGVLAPEDVESEIAPPLLGLVEYGAQTLWLTQSHLEGVDDQRLVEQWLARHFPLATEQYPAGVKLSGYMLRYEYAELPSLADTAVYPDVELQPGLRLAACEIMTPSLDARDEAMHPPSGWTHVRLWWTATTPLSDDFVATAQVIGPEGVWGDRLHRPEEALRFRPSSTWPPDIFIRDELDVNLNPLTPPGEYPVIVGVAGASGQALGDTANCGNVRVR